MYEAVIRTIPHGHQRYPTVGDYWTDDNGVLQFRISEMGDWRYEFLVALHEEVEKAITRHFNIPESAIDQFDIEYEKHRKDGDFSEPGDDCRSPYHEAHVAATYIEKQVAAFLGVEWDTYNAVVEAL